MQEHNFERQVKETMENFSVSPSAPVWQKIEKEIRQKKERRRLVLWLLPVLFAGGLWLVLAERNGVSNETSATIHNTPAGTEVTIPAKATSATVDLQETGALTTSTKRPSLPSSVTLDSREVSDEIVSTKKTFTSSGKTTNDKQFKKSRITSSYNSKNKKPAGITTYPAISPLNTGITTDTTKIITKEPEAVPDIAPALEITKAETEILKIDTTPDTAAVVAPAASQIEPTARPRKWKISVQATGGYAQTMTAFFPTAATSNASVVPTSVGFMPRVGPAEPAPGPAFSAGVVFSNTISTIVKFTTGIQYSYASTLQPFGEKAVGTWNGVTPASVDSFDILYRGGNEFNYTNKYHFAEIPVELEARLFSTLPVNVQGGASLSVLVASNAVSFDEGNDLYYRQKDKLNPLGLNVFGGFSYSFANQRLKIGPHLQYNLVPVHIGGEKRYMLSGGIRARLSLN